MRRSEREKGHSGRRSGAEIKTPSRQTETGETAAKSYGIMRLTQQTSSQIPCIVCEKV